MRLPDSGLALSTINRLLKEPKRTGLSGLVTGHWFKGAIVIFVLMLALGVFAKKGWLPHTDNLTGKKTGWFGTELPKSIPNTWNPFAEPPPSPTPQLSKEYIYAGSKLLAVADANANAAPPADLAIWRPSNGAWCILNGDSDCESTNNGWGSPGDIPVQGDYDGDGKTDFSVFRPSPSPATGPHWYIKRSSDSGITQDNFGTSTDIPVVADYDGDGKTDIAVWRPSDSHWYIQPSAAPSPIVAIQYGASGDKPVPADYDGDGKADVAVWRGTATEQKFYYRRSTDGQDPPAISMNSTGTPVCADYDGDGKADFALLTGNVWKIRSSIADDFLPTIQWYYAGDIPVPNDYDGDGKADIATWHVNTQVGTQSDEPYGYWLIRQSNNGSTRINMFGQAGDIPVPAYYRR